MKNTSEETRRLQERIARSPFPAMALGEDGRIIYRNRAAAKLFPRRRSLSSFLKEELGPGPALILHHSERDRFLIWVSPAEKGACREVRFLMDLPETEANLFRNLLRSTGAALEAGEAGSAKSTGEALHQAGAIADFLREDRSGGEEPLELGAFLHGIRPVFARSGLQFSHTLESDQEIWVHPMGGDLILALGQALRLMNGPTELSLTAATDRNTLHLSLCFPDGRGVAFALEEFFSRQDLPDLTRAAGLLPLFTAVRRCGEMGFDLRFSQEEKEGRIHLTLPAALRLPDYFISGKRPAHRRYQKDFLKW